MRKRVGIFCLGVSFIGIATEYIEQKYYSHTETDVSILLGTGTKIKKDLLNELSNYNHTHSYTFALHGSGRLKLDCNDIPLKYWARAHYVYADIQAENGDFNTPKITLCHKGGDLTKILDSFTQKSQEYKTEPQVFEIFNDNVYNWNKQNLPKDTIIVSHAPSYHHTKNSIVDESFIRMLAEYHQNDFRRFITSYLVSANEHKISIMGIDGEDTFATRLEECSKDNIKQKQDEFTVGFIEFCSEPQKGLLDECAIVTTKSQFPEWYYEVQERYLSRVQEFIFYNSILSNNKDLFQCLLNEVDVNTKLRNGVTPLFVSVLEGNVEFVESLLSNGADCSITKDNGLTALMAASFKGFANLTGVLLGHCNIDSTDAHGYNAATYASRNSQEVLSVICDHAALIGKGFVECD